MIVEVLLTFPTKDKQLCVGFNDVIDFYLQCVSVSYHLALDLK